MAGLRSQENHGNNLLLNLPVRELIRYVVVGLSLNFLGYMIYLFVTFMGVSPLMTVSIFYPLSVILGYFVHRSHTFRQNMGRIVGVALIRYVFVYAIGYFINLALLAILHQKMGYPHQLVQIVAIFMVAAFLFVAMKLFVFRK